MNTHHFVDFNGQFGFNCLGRCQCLTVPSPPPFFFLFEFLLQSSKASDILYFAYILTDVDIKTDATIHQLLYTKFHRLFLYNCLFHHNSFCLNSSLIGDETLFSERQFLTLTCTSGDIAGRRLCNEDSV